MIHFWLYASKALVAPRSHHEGSLYLSSRANNRRDGLTGHLHRAGDRFVQMIEGPEDALLLARARIARDWRHEGIVTLERGVTATRRFVGWDMAFTDDRERPLPVADALDGPTVLAALVAANRDLPRAPTGPR